MNRIILIVIALTVIYSENGYTRDKAQPSEWGARELLIEPNSEMAVALLDGKIYVVGGYPSTRISVDTVQVYDISSNSWSITTPYPTTINHASAVGVNGALYVIGGQTNVGGRNKNSSYTSGVFAFDFKTSSWTIRCRWPTSTR